MSSLRLLTLATLFLFTSAGCSSQQKKNDKEQKEAIASQPPTEVNTTDHQDITLPAPYATKVVQNYTDVIGWKDGETPKAPAGFTVRKYASGGMKSPRWLYVMPNGDIVVACANTETTTPEGLNNAISKKAKSVHTGKSANIILLFRGLDANGQPTMKDTFLTGLNQPFGMLVLGDKFYVANTDGVVVYPYHTGQTRITAAGQKILSVPPLGYTHHWTRNLLANADGSKIYITVGSGSNAAEHGIPFEDHRANIIEFNPDGSGERIYASGIRNPIGMDWAPGTHTLWTAVNERDNLGDDLVPDYLTSVKDGGFYGWPYSYWGQHVEPRLPDSVRRPDLVAKAIVPDVALGAHTASIGLAFYTKSAFPAHYQGGAFIGQHGSWNRSVLAGYRVVYVPFKNGKPSGPPEDFLTGFIADEAKSTVHGRPVCVRVLADGSMLVSDDVSDTIWRVTADK
jgi:glucose/arabinose dehydrogenase